MKGSFMVVVELALCGLWRIYHCGGLVLLYLKVSYVTSVYDNLSPFKSISNIFILSSLEELSPSKLYLDNLISISILLSFL